MSSTTTHKVRTLVPFLASGTVITTLLICLSLVKVRGIYVGGLYWPYFSDMGRDPPGYYVFCVGLSIAAALIAWTYIMNYQFHADVLYNPTTFTSASRNLQRLSLVVMIFGCLSVIGLPLLSIFSNVEYPYFHAYSAYYFFAFQNVAVIFNTMISYQLMIAVKMSGSKDRQHISVRQEKSFRHTLYIQLFFTVLFFIAFLFYIPIGLAVNPDTPRLSIDRCLRMDLGGDYCYGFIQLNETHTKLWAYDDDMAVPQMRAAGQLGCILTLVGYSVSFGSHDYALMDETRRLKKK